MKTRFTEYFGISVSLPFLGLAFAHCWMWGIQRVAASTGGNHQPYLFLGMNAACLAFAGLAALRKRSASVSWPALACFVVAGLAGTWCLLGAGAARMPAVAPWVLCGVSVGGLYLAWAHFYIRLDIRQTALVLPLTIILGSACKPLFTLLRPGLAATLAYCALPLVSLTCWRLAESMAPPRRVEPVPFAAGGRAVLCRYAVGIAVFGAAVGLARTLSAGYYALTFSSGVLSHLVEIAVCAWFVAHVYGLRDELSFSDLWMLVLVVIATGLLVVELLGGVAADVANAFFSAAQMIMYLFLLLAICDVAQREGIASDVAFGLGYPIYSVPMMLAALARPSLTWDDKGLSLLVVYALLICVAVPLRRRATGDAALFAGLSATLPAGADALSGQLASMADAYGLTERERDVARLYAQGRSRSYIASELCISENTVRDHVAHIYKKMGIHNKQEFIDVLRGVAPKAG